MTDAVDLERVGAMLMRHLTHLGCRLDLIDETTGEVHTMQADTAGAADGALPVFLAAADAICLEATGAGIGMTIEQEPAGLLGVRASRIIGVPFTVVMLAVIEATDRAREGNTIVVTNLSKVAKVARQHAALGAA